ncbi:nitroreductase family protein [Naumannella halotolerans]|uniref:Nitroreductase n=1 Tax=Naumannella halotolerans TaxID=993414 RepID=A0A4R7IYQ1_9ACTN|nr:nitroreductase family protein [Naumannella halotolerans]TDT29840.1 nitroreductase [Naumannella halotolerans]
MNLNLSADEVLTTTRSVRKRLDFDRPVEPEIIHQALEIALQAPTGSNRQGWHWMIVTDPAKKKALADIYRSIAEPYFAMPKPEYREGDARGERMSAVSSSSQYLSDNLEKAPVFVIPCMWGRVEGQDTGAVASFYGSILPAAWSFMLALRERGLGSAWTTLHLPGDGEKRAAEVLGIPYEKVTQVALLPVAYTIGTDFKPAKRQPLETVLHHDTW